MIWNKKVLNNLFTYLAIIVEICSKTLALDLFSQSNQSISGFSVGANARQISGYSKDLFLIDYKMLFDKWFEYKVSFVLWLCAPKGKPFRGTVKPMVSISNQ